MGVFPLFFLCLFFGSGSSLAKKTHPKAIRKDGTTYYTQENRIPYSDSVFTDQMDTIPVINPSPLGNPTPFYTSPPTPTYTAPATPMYTSPPTPMYTSPATPTYTAPATPMYTAPTTPTYTAPTNPTPTPTPSGGSWCIASQSASETALQVALDYACGYGGSDCSGLQYGAPCFNPNTVRDHASYAFNEYYQKNPVPTSCAFGGTAQLTSIDPSSGNCHYSSSKSTPSTSTTMSPPAPPATPTPLFMSPNVPTTPSSSFDTPAGTSIYGPEPTDSPSSAVATAGSRVLLVVAVTAGLVASIRH